MAYRHRRRFGGGYGRHRAPKEAVKVAPQWVLKKKRKCDTCTQLMNAGDIVTRFALAKQFRGPCTSCGRVPRKTKYYHVGACVPADANAAMGHNPAAAPASPYQQPAAGGAVPPPPKPLTFEESAFAALAAVESAFSRRIATDADAWVNVTDPTTGKTKRNVKPELEKAFKTYSNIKARAIRPGTDAEGATSTSLALQKLIKLMYSDFKSL